MKSTITYFLFFLIIISSRAANGQYEPDMLYLDYSNSNGERGISTYIYNGRKTPYKAIWELKDGSRWSVNYHEFDHHGNLLKKYREFSDSITVEQEFQYDENQHLVSETFSRSDGTTGNVQYHYKGDQLQWADCDGLNGWFHGKIEYNYNPGGEPGSAIDEIPGSVINTKPHSEINTKPRSANIIMKDQPAGTISYQYDSQNRLHLETWEFTVGFTQTFEYIYLDRSCTRYRSSNAFIDLPCSVIVSKEEYDYSGKGGGPSYYEYEDGNKLVKKTFVRSDGLKTITTYDYAQDGRLLSSKRNYADGRTGEFSYAYNDQGKLAERKFVRSDGDTSSEIYEYDTNGRLISAEYENFDGWLSGILNFNHDRYDRITSAQFKSSKGNHAQLQFAYNEENQLIKIHWSFNNGTSQTYIFEYKSI